jgi:hypothetical protein
MADTPVVSGPLPLWYVAACMVRPFNAGLPGGWGGLSVFDSLARRPGAGVSRRKWLNSSVGFVPTSTPVTPAVVSYTNLAAFPTFGETGKVYVAQNTGKFYRWTGSVYAEVNPSLPGY